MQIVLVIDDSAAVCLALEVLFSLHGIDTVSASTPGQGLDFLDRHEVDLVIQDMNFSADTTSGEDGMALFHEIRQRHPDLPVILLTAWTNLAAAVDLIKAGAADYLSKPWDDVRLVMTVANLLELGQANRALQKRLRNEKQQRAELELNFDLRGFVWGDPATERALHLACKVARADVPILITGPNGTGKERIAEIVQANSSVKDGPFIIINCGALPSELIEAELFGVEAGAYTGATKTREGKFEAADGGTLFLDEIGNLPLNGQIKLLRVLETGNFSRLGSNKEQHVKVRIISATNSDLSAMIQAGAFREDLYYRLNVIQLRLPALAERPGDILPLAANFLGNGKTLHAAAQASLLAYAWPGNIRELKNVITRASLLATNDIIKAEELALPEHNIAIANNEPDRAAIIQTLKRCGGVIAQAAGELGLSRQALYRRMERFGITHGNGS